MCLFVYLKRHSQHRRKLSSFWASVHSKRKAGGMSLNGRNIYGIVNTEAQIAVVSEDCFKNLKLPVGCARFFSAERGREHYLHKDCIRGHSPFQNWEHRSKMEAHCG
jgi:hypothetical protein